MDLLICCTSCIIPREHFRVPTNSATPTSTTHRLKRTSQSHPKKKKWSGSTTAPLSPPTIATAAPPRTAPSTQPTTFATPRPPLSAWAALVAAPAAKAPPPSRPSQPPRPPDELVPGLASSSAWSGTSSEHSATSTTGRAGVR